MSITHILQYPVNNKEEEKTQKWNQNILHHLLWYEAIHIVWFSFFIENQQKKMSTRQLSMLNVIFHCREHDKKIIHEDHGIGVQVELLKGHWFLQNIKTNKQKRTFCASNLDDPTIVHRDYVLMTGQIIACCPRTHNWLCTLTYAYARTDWSEQTDKQWQSGSLNSGDTSSNPLYLSAAILSTLSLYSLMISSSHIIQGP